MAYRFLNGSIECDTVDEAVSIVRLLQKEGLWPVAKKLIETSTETSEAARALGAIGGRKGGLARAAKLSEEQRSEIAQKAAKARWAKKGTK